MPIIFEDKTKQVALSVYFFKHKYPEILSNIFLTPLFAFINDLIINYKDIKIIPDAGDLSHLNGNQLLTVVEGLKASYKRKFHKNIFNYL